MAFGARLWGKDGAILWGYHTAAELSGWTIVHAVAGPKVPGGKATPSKVWKLTATARRVEPFQLRQKGLLFTAPHEKGRDGFWAWAIETLETKGNRIEARLGQPEQ